MPASCSAWYTPAWYAPSAPPPCRTRTTCPFAAGPMRCGAFMLLPDGRGDGRDHAARRGEFAVAVGDAVALGDPFEVVVDGPDFARLVLADEQADWPV